MERETRGPVVRVKVYKEERIQIINMQPLIGSCSEQDYAMEGGKRDQRMLMEDA